MGQVGKNRLLCTNAAGCFNGLADAQMGGVGGMTERIENQHIQPLQAGGRCIVDLLHVGNIGNPAQSVSQHRHLSVLKLEGEDLLSGCHEGHSCPHRVQLQPWLAGTRQGGDAIKYVAEVAAELSRCVSRGIYRNGLALEQRIGAEVVDPVDVIGVMVGVEHRIDAPGALLHQLQAQLWWGVDQDGIAPAFNQGGGAVTVVAGIGGGADPAETPWLGHTHGGPGAQQGQLHDIRPFPL